MLLLGKLNPPLWHQIQYEVQWCGTKTQGKIHLHRPLTLVAYLPWAAAWGITLSVVFWDSTNLPEMSRKKCWREDCDRCKPFNNWADAPAGKDLLRNHRSYINIYIYRDCFYTSYVGLVVVISWRTEEKSTLCQGRCMLSFRITQLLSVTVCCSEDSHSVECAAEQCLETSCASCPPTDRKSYWQCFSIHYGMVLGLTQSGAEWSQNSCLSFGEDYDYYQHYIRNFPFAVKNIDWSRGVNRK